MTSSTRDVAGSRRAAGAIALAAALALAGCGGGGGGGGDGGFRTDDPAAEGAYSGTLTGTPATAFDLIVLEDGTYWAMYGQRAAGALLVTGFVQGTGGTEAITFAGGPMPASLYRYDMPAALSTIVGRWSLTPLNGTAASMDIADDGTFSVTASGCAFSGTATPRPSRRNVFDLALVFGPSPCSLPGQPATGVALAHPLATGEMQLVMGAVDATRNVGVGAIGRR